MDGTMIGDTTYMTKCISTVEFIRNSYEANKLTNISAPPNLLTYADIYDKKLIRPNLKELLHGIKEHFPTAELFVYSHGVKDYVNDLVSIIEKETDFTFNRPLFSREDSVVTENGYQYKSILVRFPTIVKVLLSKYPALKEEHAKEEVLASRIIFIDDYDFVWDRKDKWLKCPGYKYTSIIDISKYLPIDNTRDPLVKSYMTKQGGLFIEPDGVTIDVRNMLYHIHMANTYGTVIEQNKQAETDTFCKDLLRKLKTYKRLVKPFTEEHIKELLAP